MANSKIIWIPESGNPGNFCAWNPISLALESGLLLQQSVIPLTIGIRNPNSTGKDRNPASGIGSPKRGIRNPTWSEIYSETSI